VLVFQGTPFWQYLVGAGILRQSQIDSSYDGSPDRFVASRGKIAVQAYATNEPYSWSHEVPAWNKPLTYQLINDTGYPNYANLLAIRPADKPRLDGCLKKLVPIIQQGQVDFMANPGPATDLIVGAVQKEKGFTYTRALADYATKTMREQQIVWNGSDRKTLGNFQEDRIKRLINILTPIFTGQKKKIKDNLQFSDIVTNEYVDPNISLPGSGGN
jgi:hypothetical protein